MSDTKEPDKTFRVTIEDCDRWLRRFHRMAKSLEGKEKQEDGIRMFYTAAVLMQKFRTEIEYDSMMTEVEQVALFGKKPIGEA